MFVFPFADRCDSHFRQLIDLPGIQPHCAGPVHGVKHFVEHFIDHEHFFFGNAQQIVVVRRAANDVLGGPIQIGGLVDHDRRISRTGHNGPLRAFHCRPRNGRPAGYANQFHAAMLEQSIGAFQRWLGDYTNQIVDAHVFVNRLIEPPHPFGRHPLSAGMRIDDQRVAAGNHAYRVSGNRRQRMRNRRDATDHSERCVLDDRQPVIAAEHLALQKFDAGSALAQRFQFFDLVLPAGRLLSLPFPSCPARCTGRWRCGECGR